MARGFGRTLDFTTLIVILRNDLDREDIDGFQLSFDKNKGWSAAFNGQEPSKWFETFDSALLALHVGSDKVLGVGE